MADVEKISVTLTGEQIDALKTAVDAGEYATTSDIIREAVRDWQIKREMRQEDIARLRRLWDDGIASGFVGPVDMGDVRNKARERLSEARKALGNAD